MRRVRTPRRGPGRFGAPAGGAASPRAVGRGGEAVADADHGVDAEAVRWGAAAQAVGVDVQALGLEGRAGGPRVALQLRGRDDAAGVAGEAREQEELLARQSGGHARERDVVVVVLDAQPPVVVHARAFRRRPGPVAAVEPSSVLM